MLQSLEDIQIFTKLLNEGSISSDIHELDSNYLKLSNMLYLFRHWNPGTRWKLWIVQENSEICEELPCKNPYCL